MKYSICIDSVFGREKPIAERIQRVREAGFSAFEFWTWWDQDLESIRRAKEDSGLILSSCCAKFVSLTDPALRGEYLASLRESVETARFLGCKNLIAQTGNDTGADRQLQQDSIVEGLRLAAPILEDAGITLLLEPLNTTVDHKGYYLWQSREGYEIIDKVNSPAVRVLFDIYHQQIMEGNLVQRIREGADRIAYYHVAGNPGRHEPHLGEIHYPFVIDAIRESGYDGFIGLEYFPTIEPMSSLELTRERLPKQW